jgi:hypothetical protein
MVRGNEFPNRGLQLSDATVHASTELFVRELGEPALDEVQPRPRGRREVDMKRDRLANQFFRIGGVLWVP